jgi:UDP-4-amino-4-deoxy-L-arabinose-oxoglutarate aminotransferase
MTWVSTVNLIVLAGATPVFVDVDRDTLMVTPEAIAEKTTSRTKLIIPVHFAGAAADLDPIRQMAQRRGIHLIEDAAHAVGTEYRGVKIGKAGTAIFSCHPIKNITTGEGGVVTSDDPALIERVKRLKFHGLGVDAFDRQTLGRSPQAEVLEPGYKYNLPDLAAVLGIRQLARVDEFNAKRAELALYYREQFKNIPEILPLADPAYPIRHAWHLFIIRLDTDRAGISRDDFMRELKQRNIGTGLHFKAVHVQKYYVEKMGMRRGMLPNTEWNSDRICSLPLFPDMTRRDADDVIAAIKEVLKR